MSVGGIIELATSVKLRAKGSFSYGLGLDERQAVVDHDGVAGFTRNKSIGYIEGVITDTVDLSIKELHEYTGTVTLGLDNGKIITLRDAFFIGTGEGSTEQGEVNVRFEGNAEEIR
jgi:hypothetical protein